MTADDTTNMSVNGEDMAAEENKIENICIASAVVEDSLLAKARSERGCKCLSKALEDRAIGTRLGEFAMTLEVIRKK